MSAKRVQAGEVPTDVSLVGRLLTAQFPEWAGLPIKPGHSGGTDNAIYRLGDDMAVRLPRGHRAALQLRKEQCWLRQLGASVPLPIPLPLAKGEPAEGYGWPWSVYRWLSGGDATVESVVEPERAAVELGHFVAALQQVDPTGAPRPGEHNAFRGVPLADRDSQTRSAIGSLHPTIDKRAALTAWEAAVRTPAWTAAPVWLHGDLQPANLLCRYGVLRAVVDFGFCGIGDPACDVMVAWTFFSGSSRDAFRDSLQVDDADWARGRGWALSVGLIALAHHQDSDPVQAGSWQRVVDEVLADQE